MTHTATSWWRQYNPILNKPTSLEPLAPWSWFYYGPDPAAGVSYGQYYDSETEIDVLSQKAEKVYSPATGKPMELVSDIDEEDVKELLSKVTADHFIHQRECSDCGMNMMASFDLSDAPKIHCVGCGSGNTETRGKTMETSASEKKVKEVKAKIKANLLKKRKEKGAIARKTAAVARIKERTAERKKAALAKSKVEEEEYVTLEQIALAMEEEAPEAPEVEEEEAEAAEEEEMVSLEDIAEAMEEEEAEDEAPAEAEAEEEEEAAPAEDGEDEEEYMDLDLVLSMLKKKERVKKAKARAVARRKARAEAEAEEEAPEEDEAPAEDSEEVPAAPMDEAEPDMLAEENPEPAPAAEEAPEGEEEEAESCEDGEDMEKMEAMRFEPLASIGDLDKVAKSSIDMVLYNEESKNPTWHVSVAGIPVARIQLQTQASAEDIRSVFCSEDYALDLVEHCEKSGFVSTMKKVSAEFWANKTSNAKISSHYEDLASKKFEADKKAMVSAFRDNFMNCLSTVSLGMNKNFFPEGNSLKDALFTNLNTLGLPESSAISAIESSFKEASAEYFSALFDKATEYMNLTVEARAEIAKAIGNSDVDLAKMNEDLAPVTLNDRLVQASVAPSLSVQSSLSMDVDDYKSQLKGVFKK